MSHPDFLSWHQTPVSGDSLKHLPVSITISPATLYHRCPEAILQVKALLYQPLDLTRQLFLCLLASRAVMDFLNESLFSFYRFHTFSTGLLGLSPGQILYHWLWFPEVSDPSLQVQWALPEIWPYFGSLCLILYTLMQSEVARLNSLSIPPTLRSLRASRDPQLGLISCMLRNVNDTAILRSIKLLDDISVALMKTGIRSSRRPTAGRWTWGDCLFLWDRDKENFKRELFLV